MTRSVRGGDCDLENRKPNVPNSVWFVIEIYRGGRGGRTYGNVDVIYAVVGCGEGEIGLRQVFCPAKPKAERSALGFGS